MCELDYKESWTLKSWCFWTVVLEKSLESLLDCKEIQPVHPKGSQHWLFIGGTDAEAEAPILWPTDSKSRLIRKDPDAGKDWRQEKWTTEDEMVGWHHWVNGHEFEQTPVVGDRQGSLACCSPWGHKESDMTKWLNWIELRQMKRNYCIIIIGHLALCEYISSFGYGLFIQNTGNIYLIIILLIIADRFEWSWLSSWQCIITSCNLTRTFLSGA